VILTRGYPGDRVGKRRTSGDAGVEAVAGGGDRLLDVAGGVSAKALVAMYCKALYERYGTYEEVARRTGLDRRTAKGYVAGG
jgi:hypothetical protein